MKDSLLIAAIGIAYIVLVAAGIAALAGAMTGTAVLWQDVHPLVGVLFALSFVFVSIAAILSTMPD